MMVKGMFVLKSDIVDSNNVPDKSEALNEANDKVYYHDLDKSELFTKALNEATAKIHNEHKKVIDEVIDWCNKLDLCIVFGGTADNKYICEYAFSGLTKAYLKGLVAELKAMLKSDFPQIKEHHQVIFESRGN